MTHVPPGGTLHMDVDLPESTQRYLQQHPHATFEYRVGRDEPTEGQRKGEPGLYCKAVELIIDGESHGTLIINYRLNRPTLRQRIADWLRRWI